MKRKLTTPIWLSLIEDEEIRSKALANYNPNFDSNKKGLYESLQIGSAFDWAKSSEGAAYWEGKHSVKLREPIKFEEVVVNVTCKEEWVSVCGYYKYNVADKWEKESKRYGESIYVNCYSQGWGNKPVMNSPITYQQWLVKIGAVVGVKEEYYERPFKSTDLIEGEYYVSGLHEEASYIHKETLEGYFMTFRNSSLSVDKFLRNTEYSYRVATSEEKDRLESLILESESKPNVEVEHSDGKLEVDNWYKCETVLMYITKLTQTGGNDIISGYGFDGSEWIKEDSEWAASGWTLATGDEVHKRLIDYAKEHYRRRAEIRDKIWE